MAYIVVAILVIVAVCLFLGKLARPWCLRFWRLRLRFLVNKCDEQLEYALRGLSKAAKEFSEGAVWNELEECWKGLYEHEHALHDAAVFLDRVCRNLNALGYCPVVHTRALKDEALCEAALDYAVAAMRAQLDYVPEDISGHWERLQWASIEASREWAKQRGET